MKQKVNEKLQAIAQRKQGRTVTEIAEYLKVSKSSVSCWVRNIPLSQKAQSRLSRKITAGQLAGTKSIRARTASIEKGHFEFAYKQGSELIYNQNHIRTICALIYWCEGAKKVDRVDFTNADPQLVQLFLNFFRSAFALDESKFRVCLHLHTYHNTTKQISFWSNVTKISKKQFTKPYQKTNTGVQIRENYQGCASIRYHEADVARQLLATAKATFALYH